MPAVERPAARTLELRLLNERESIARAHALLDGYLDPELGEAASSATRLVIEELVANAIAYAFPTGGQHEIRVTVAIAADAVRVTVSDDGQPFDPFAPRPEPSAHSIADAAIGGRGLLLVRAVTRARSYRRDSGRNIVELEIAR